MHLAWIEGRALCVAFVQPVGSLFSGDGKAESKYGMVGVGDWKWGSTGRKQFLMKVPVAGSSSRHSINWILNRMRDYIWTHRKTEFSRYGFLGGDEKEEGRASTAMSRDESYWEISSHRQTITSSDPHLPQPSEEVISPLHFTISRPTVLVHIRVLSHHSLYERWPITPSFQLRHMRWLTSVWYQWALFAPKRTGRY